MNPQKLLAAYASSKHAGAARGKLFVNTYVVYNHPADYPDKFVTRLWVIVNDEKGSSLVPTGQQWVCDTMADAQRACPRTGEWFGREVADDPVIAETWVDWATLPEWMLGMIAKQQAELMAKNRPSGNLRRIH